MTILPRTIAMALVAGLAFAGRAAAEPAQIRVDVALVDHDTGRGRVVSGSRIEGRAGTDFDIELALDDYVLTGHFITDLVGQHALEIQAHLVARQRQGRSARGLPLWEEDVQDRTLTVGFDESLVLWPFGRERRRLAIEITPAPAMPGLLRITPLAPERGGTLRVHARRIPHRFVCDATVVDAEGTTTHATSDCRLGRIARLPLGPAAQGRTVAVTVEDYQRDRPVDTVSIALELADATAGGSSLHALAVAAVGEPQRHALGAAGAELRIVVRLADGESPD